MKKKKGRRKQVYENIVCCTSFMNSYIIFLNQYEGEISEIII